MPDSSFLPALFRCRNSRHTINTIVRNSGHDPAKIRAVLGWMDEAVQENYTHWDLDHLKAWADIVDSIWEG
jgi:integrase